MSEKLPAFAPRYRIVPGVDPTNDWRAPYVYWPRNRLLACAAALEELIGDIEANSESGAPAYAFEALEVE